MGKLNKEMLKKLIEHTLDEEKSRLEGAFGEEIVAVVFFDALHTTLCETLYNLTEDSQVKEIFKSRGVEYPTNMLPLSQAVITNLIKTLVLWNLQGFLDISSSEENYIKLCNGLLSEITDIVNSGELSFTQNLN